jgi:hypothetical protein
MIVQNVVLSNDTTIKQQSNMISFAEKFGTEEQCLLFFSPEKWGQGFRVENSISPYLLKVEPGTNAGARNVDMTNLVKHTPCFIS